MPNHHTFPVAKNKLKRFGSANNNWRGGRSLASNGYMLLRVGAGHHLADVRGYAYEHRVIAEKKIGRRLTSKEQVHHINGNKLDNRPENLHVVESIAQHRSLHRSPNSKLIQPGQSNFVVFCKCGCGEAFDAYDRNGRPRVYISGHNPKPSPTCDAIIELLRDGEKSVREIVDAIGRGSAPTKAALCKMKKSGIIKNVARGVYALSQL